MRNPKYTVPTSRYTIRLEDAKINFLKEIYTDMGVTQIIDMLIDERIRGVFELPKKIKSAIIRMGGKSLIADKIVDIFPEHECFIDVFMGACHVLLAKPKETSKVEVVNDRNGELTNLFEQIKYNPIALRQELLEMSISRRYFNELATMKELPKDKIKRASRTIYLIQNSFYGDARNGFRANTSRNMADKIEKITNDFVYIQERFKDVVIENMDYKALLRKYDKVGKDNVLYYMDPPYLIDKKPKGLYEHEFGYKETEKMCKIVNGLRGKVILSHYRSEKYDEWLEGWNVHEIVTYKAFSKVTEGVKEKVIEALYCNFKTKGKEYV